MRKVHENADLEVWDNGSNELIIKTKSSSAHNAVEIRVQGFTNTDMCYMRLIDQTGINFRPYAVNGCPAFLLTKMKGVRS